MANFDDRILITGVNGFIGQALLRHFVQVNSFNVRGVGRSAQAKSDCEYFVADLSADVNWDPIVGNVSTIIHCAARIPDIAVTASDALDQFQKINRDGTLKLATKAASSGVKRFIFVSTVKVNGEHSCIGRPFQETDDPDPVDPYAISKWEAELGLIKLSKLTGMEVVIIRPPLVYGPGVGGNFLSLLKLANSGLPLPLGSISNRRSMVFIGNLVDLISRCVVVPSVVNQTFLVSDGCDLSTAGLLRAMRGNIGRPARLLPFPPSLLYSAGRLVGKVNLVDRLCGSLQVDITKVKEHLNWAPPYSVEYGLKLTVESFLENARKKKYADTDD